MHIEINTTELTVEDRRALIALLSEYDRPASIPMPTRTMILPAVEFGPEARIDVVKPASEALIEAATAQRTPSEGVTLDKNGLPHDARIHASTAVLNVDGTWRAKRNVDSALVETVEAELHAVMAAPGPVPTPPVAMEVPPVPTPPVPPPPVPTLPVAEAAAAAAVSPFAAVMKRVVALQGAGRITSAEVTQTCVDIGLGNIRDLAKRPDLIPSFEALLPE